MYYAITFLILMMGYVGSVYAGNKPPADSITQRTIELPKKYLSQVASKSTHVNDKLNKLTEKALKRFTRREKKMQAKLWKVDSVAAKNIFTFSLNKLNSLKAGLKNKIPGNGSSDNTALDTLQNSLRFLSDSKTISGVGKDKLGNATQRVQELEGKLQQVEEVKSYIREHKQQLKEQLKQYTGFTKDLQRMNKEAYYYGQQINEYKSLLSDKKKAEAKALALLKKLPAYNNFLQQHSQLSGLFNLTAASNVQSLEGLQTRSQVEEVLQQRIGNMPAAQQAVSQQMDQARSQFNELKNKFPGLDNAGDMPAFKPNEMKTKSFLKRLEFGGNVQFQKSDRYFPTTSDIAGQVAYKFHKNGSAGLGASYKLGLGKGWNNISLSHQGIGLRSFVDWKLKGTFFVNGGFEENYITAFSHVGQLTLPGGWQGSALLGISKKYKINTKLKGNVMILYDFLAKRNQPPASPVKLRIGYNF